MIWFLCRSLRLNQSINHNRCGGVRHMRQNIYEIWQHLISLRLGQELFYIAKWMLAGLLVTLVKVSVLLSETEHLTLLAAIHVRAICWCVWLPAHIASVQPFYLTGWGRNRFPGLVKWQAITSTKLGQTLVMTVTRTIFNAMKRHCCCQHCFLRERMMRQWEWKRATLYKEDYEDKTALTSLKFEDASTEIWRLSKTRCLSGGWQLAVSCAVVNVTGGKKNIEFLLLDSKADTLQKSTCQRGIHLCHAEQGHLKQNTRPFIRKATNK